MAKGSDFEIEIATAGLGRTMTFRPHVVSCGAIWNGVGVQLGQDAGWVIAFVDLERVYLAAKAFRATSAGKRHLAAAERDYGT